MAFLLVKRRNKSIEFEMTNHIPFLSDRVTHEWRYGHGSRSSERPTFVG